VSKPTHKITVEVWGERGWWHAIDSVGGPISLLPTNSHCITKVEALPNPIGVGDIVTWGYGYVGYRVVAIHRDDAWLADCSDERVHVTHQLSDLRRLKL